MQVLGHHRRDEARAMLAGGLGTFVSVALSRAAVDAVPGLVPTTGRDVTAGVLREATER
jgi:hypothetical protein